MSVYKRAGSPFFYYSFTIDGVRYRGSTESPVGKGKRAAERKADLIRDEIAEQVEIKRKFGADWRIRDVLGAYWNERLKHGNTKGGQEAMVLNLSALLGPDTMLSDVTNVTIIDMIAKRRGQTTGKLNPRLIARNTVNRDLATLKAAFRHAHLIHKKPLPAINWKELMVAEPPNRTRFLSRDEFDRLIAAADPVIVPIIRFAVLVGLRKGNVLNLDWNEVNLGNALVTVKVKGGKGHSVKLTAPLRADLARTDPDKRKGKVFDTTNFRRRFAKAVKDAGLVNFKFHDLRHTSASWARQAGADIADIKEHLGHSSISVTMRYAHIVPEEHVTAADRVSEKLWSQNLSQSRKKKAKNG